MKILSQPVQILEISEDEEQTFLLVGLDISKETILKYKTPEGMFAIIKFYDSRRINEDQRKKIFAICKDIAAWSGDTKELARSGLTLSFCQDTEKERFSLSDCSLEIAREFINYLIEYVIENDVPLTDKAINRTDDIDKYLYYCLKYSKCCICGKKAINYTLSNKAKICLCDIHHDIAKTKGLKEFEKAWKVYGIKYEK